MLAGYRATLQVRDHQVEGQRRRGLYPFKMGQVATPN